MLAKSIVFPNHDRDLYLRFPSKRCLDFKLPRHSSSGGERTSANDLTNGSGQKNVPRIQFADKGLSVVGNLRRTTTQDRMAQFWIYKAKP